jgi:hypothetical protein
MKRTIPVFLMLADLHIPWHSPPSGEGNHLRGYVPDWSATGSNSPDGNNLYSFSMFLSSADRFEVHSGSVLQPKESNSYNFEVTYSQRFMG